jgi:outer membrane protein assembly factor BamB
MQKKLLITILFFTFCPLIFSQEMAQWRGMNRDGIYNETGLLKSWPETGPKLLWHNDEIGEGHSSVAVTADRVFTAGLINGIGYLFAFAPDGKLVWKVPYGEEWTESYQGTRSTPLIYDGKVYLMSAMGKLICRKADDGDFVWSVDLVKDFGAVNIRWGMTENLLADGNKIFCTAGGPDNNIVAFDKNTGKVIWTSKAKGETSAYCSPTLLRLQGKRIFVTHTASSITGLDADNGKLLWSIDQPNKYSVHANTPVFLNGNLFCVSGYGKGGVMLKVAPDGSSVQEIWRSTLIDNRMGGFIILDGKIFGSDDTGKAWYCLDFATGKELYSEKITGKGNITCADGMLYCYGESGEVVLVQPTATGFKKAGAFKVPYGSAQHWAFPVIANGRLYLRHGSSVMVYDLKK